MAGELTLRYVRRLGKRSESQFMRGERFAQAHEGRHDIRADFDDAGCVQDGRRHERAVFGKRERHAVQPHFCARFGKHTL